MSAEAPGPQERAGRQSFTEMWPEVEPGMAPCTGRPKALMTSSRCHLPHPYLVTGLGCMGCALGCIISLSCCFLMPTSHPCLRGPPRAEQWLLVPRDRNMCDRFRSGVGPLGRQVHVGKHSQASSQLPRYRLSQLTSGEALPLTLLRRAHTFVLAHDGQRPAHTHSDKPQHPCPLAVAPMCAVMFHAPRRPG